MLAVNLTSRISAQNALRHEYFNDLNVNDPQDTDHEVHADDGGRDTDYKVHADDDNGGRSGTDREVLC